ncbi:hypothetical protein [Actinomadura sp. SCN-SB]|uniref:hypothetical protein n=1 Tax=Actinomadura sp. SCN-SB TaxID=3373092 RepID=UPI00374FE7F7
MTEPGTPGNEQAATAEAPVEQLPVDDWTDQDLLTKVEAAGRLEARIAEVSARIEALAAAGAATGVEGAALERRMAALRSALADLRG